MFTGIIEELGEVRRIQRIGRNTLLKLKVDKIYKDTNIGDSIAVNGTCLTIVKKQDNILAFEIIPQTLESTNLGILRVQDKVNLERSLKVGDRGSGHFIYGHIDCIGIIRRKAFTKDNLCFDIIIPHKLISRILPHGSIAVDGVSLTVQKKISNFFSVYVIPHTHNNTTLGSRHPSDKVNVEIDKLGMLSTSTNSAILNY